MHDIAFLFLPIDKPFYILKKQKNINLLCVIFYFIFSHFIRRIHESLEESGHRRSVRCGRTIRQIGLGGVARRENDTGHRAGQTGRIQGGHRRRSAVRHARAVAKGRAVSARRAVLPAQHDRQG